MHYVYKINNVLFNPCFSGVLNGFVPLKKDGSLDLNHVLLKSGCMCCGKELSWDDGYITVGFIELEYGSHKI